MGGSGGKGPERRQGPEWGRSAGGGAGRWAGRRGRARGAGDREMGREGEARAGGWRGALSERESGREMGGEAGQGGGGEESKGPGGGGEPGVMGWVDGPDGARLRAKRRNGGRAGGGEGREFSARRRVEDRRAAEGRTGGQLAEGVRGPGDGAGSGGGGTEMALGRRGGQDADEGGRRARGGGH
nr:glycine-rich cell wall structural protein 1.8-like [Chelonoidis abingdonii]